MSVDMLFFEIQEIGCHLSLMKIICNLKKRTTKSEKFVKYLKTNIKTFRYEVTASGNINRSNLCYTLLRPVSSLRLPKEQKRKNSRFGKN